MPTVSNSHNENLKKVCIICIEKDKTIREVNPAGPTFRRLQKYFLSSLDFSSIIYPTGICDKDRKKLELIEKGIKMPSDLPLPFDFSKVQVTLITRNSPKCCCVLCVVARETIKPGPPKIKRGRPSTTQSTLPPVAPVTVCQRCLSSVGRGLPHQCNISVRRENIELALSKGEWS